jgi:stage II sporulation protein D
LDDIRERELLCVEAQENETLKVTSLNRTQGAPEYLGRLYLWREADGIALVNELPLEEYLYAVVSSEMPSYYPIEAQKAQAVCARTYAVNCIGSREDEALIDRDVSIQWDEQDTWWDLSDSVEYQVYNNVPSTKRSIQAVDETAGEVLPLDDIQYYSTSCGSEHRSDIGEEDAFVSFLNEEPEDGEEYDSRYLRWSGEIEKEKLTEKLMREYPKLQNELELTVERRRGDGQVQSLTVSGEAGSITIEGEYEIRKALGGMDTELTLMDGSCVTAGNLLPSAFFYLTEEADCWRISGGGYGHGNGMSQCGAAAMAEKGMDYQEIIGYYYSIRTTGKTE